MARALPTGTVTFLFTDIEGSTRLLEELGRDRYVRALNDHRRLLRDAFASFGGFEVEMQGDSFHFAFDQARDAVLAAAEAQRALGEHAWESHPIRVRTGVHTGEPIVSENLYAGVDVHRAARIMAAGHGGQVLVSEATRMLAEADLPDDVVLRDLGEHRLKDLSRPVRIYQLGSDEHPPLKTLYRTNLPYQPTPFVGRERELGETGALLTREDVRLVALTGAGGSGKTRLGLQVAAESAEHFRDGVYWVSLAPIQNAELVLPALARALDVREVSGQALDATVRAALAQRTMLILFDNFEHVLEGRSVLADLLARCAGVHFLVTSRRPLQLSSEHVYTVPPLRELDAVELFVQRARQVADDFVADETVTLICRRLDGLPLAIELAAARVRVLEPEALLERLERRLPLLTGGAADLPARQQTLRATIAWSYELLSNEEQRVFRALGVFAGSFSVEAAEAVCETNLDTIEELVAKSLARHWGGGGLGMLETIREFALEELAKAGEQEQVADRHADHYLSLAERLEGHLRSGPQRVRSLDRIAAELDNIRVALNRFEEIGAGERVLRLATALWRFWMARGYFSAGRRWLERGLRHAHDPADPLRARALEAMAVFVALGGDLQRSRDLAEESLHLYRQLDDQRGVAETLNNLGVMATNRGDRTGGKALLEQSAAVASETADQHTLGLAAANLAELALEEGAYERAASLTLEAADRWERFGDPGYNLFTTLGNALYAQGRLDEAHSAFIRCLGGIDKLTQRDYVSATLLGLAAVAASQGDNRRGAILVGASDALLEAIGGSWEAFGPFVQTLRERTFDDVSRALEVEAFAAVYEDGRALTLDQAIAEAKKSRAAPALGHNRSASR